MHNDLDKKLRIERTLNEAKIMIHLRSQGLPVPAVLDVDIGNGIIVMEWIDGDLLRDRLLRSVSSRENVSIYRDIFYFVGETLGKIHDLGYYHGDPTVSNFIVDTTNRIWLIDFGLAGYSRDPEEWAVDLHLLFRSIETLIHEEVEKLKESIIKGYAESMKSFNYKRVLELVEDIRLRGRYIEKRRKIKTVW